LQNTSPFSAPIAGPGPEGLSIVQFVAAATTAPEAGGSAVILVARSGFGDSTVTVQAAATAGMALPSVDFVPTTQTLTFLPGQTVAALPVTLGANPRARNSSVTVNLALSAASSGAALGTQSNALLTLNGTALLADLAIDNRASARTVTAGGTLSYTITVKNNGPADVTAAHVADAFPVTLRSVQWTASASAGSSVAAAAGSGNIATSVDLRAGGTATFTVRAVVSSTASGQIQDTARVTAPATVTDPNLGNNSSLATITVQNGQGLTSTKIRLDPPAPNPAQPGQQVTLSAVVSALGTARPPAGELVSFLDGGTTLGTAKLDSHGRATFVTAALGIGAHKITAVYGGDSSFKRSASSSPIVETIVAPSSDGPRIVAVERFGFHAMPTILVLDFNEPLDRASAQDVRNYQIIGPGGRTIPIGAVSYDSDSHEVTIAPAERLNLHYTYRLIVIGTTHTGVRDLSGNLLDGAANGKAGSDFVTLVTAADLVVPNLPVVLNTTLSTEPWFARIVERA
jgi:uncharacterized repeat protein (TIGR01451 family)